MNRYYFVSYLYTDKKGLGSGFVYTKTQIEGIIISKLVKELNENGISNVTILKFIEIAKEHFELNIK